jgi:ABC-type Fe3+-citrate transport system substrate-binding protein
MSVRVIDALGRELVLDRAPTRVVSLVPSETETVAAIAGLSRLVGRTDFCEEPSGKIECVPSVGGTKKLDVGRVASLGPDLILANKEENGQRDIEALIALGLPVFVSFPCTLRESLVHLETTAHVLHVPPESVAELVSLKSELARLDAAPHGSRLRVFVPIWKSPWMSFDGRTYGSDILNAAGFENVFADRARHYPLAADLGRAEPTSSEGRDTRYPRFLLEEVRDRKPELVLLPDEPYRFGEEDAREIDALGMTVPIEFVSGKDLFWYGVRSIGALERLTALLEKHRELRE